MINYDDLNREVIGYRRDLHKIPELGFLVYKTGAYVRETLSQLDCTVESVAKTGLVAFFDFGKEETLCFRADMDGLPIEEATGLPYSSKHPGCMHACGHDGHMAIMLGFSKVLNQYKMDDKKPLYNALLLFQPAEETIDGALKILGTHIFSKYNVKAIFGLHLWPLLEKGEITTKPGHMMAKSTAIAVNMVGLSAHCGEPEKGIDALAAGCRFVNLIYKFKDNHVKERSILKFGKMESGNVRNAISPHTRLDGTMRTFEEKTWRILVNALRHYARQVEREFGVTVTIDTSKFHPAVINDEKLYTEVKDELIENHMNFVEMRRPVMVAEDFSFFEEEIPGIFFFLGTGCKIPLHSDNYDFDDSVLIEGVKLFTTLFRDAQ